MDFLNGLNGKCHVRSSDPFNSFPESVDSYPHPPRFDVL